MEFWKQLISNRILLTAAVGWFLAQAIKTILYMALQREWNWERMWGAGGMPSSHSSMVCALTVAVGRGYGVSSAVFAIALMFAFVTIYDAMGVRREAGKHAHLLNKYLNIFNPTTESETEFEPSDSTDDLVMLKELIGHSPLEVIGGIILGLLVGFLMPM